MAVSLEDQLARYRAEDSDVMMSIYTLEAEYRSALQREEEKGYERGLRDGQGLSAKYLMTKGACCERNHS